MHLQRFRLSASPKGGMQAGEADESTRACADVGRLGGAQELEASSALWGLSVCERGLSLLSGLPAFCGLLYRAD